MFKRLQTGLNERFRKLLAGLTVGLRGARTGQPPAATPVAALPAAQTNAEHVRAARAAFEAGRTAFGAKNYPAAVECFKAAVELRHDDADAHNWLGLSYLEQGLHEDAADCFLLALHHHPRFPQALNNLALVALQRADFDEAVVCLERAIALMPDYAVAHNNLGYVLCRELGDSERGGAHIREALRLSPHDSDTLCNYSMLLIQEGRSEEALAICDRQLAAHPHLHEARLNRAIARLTLGRFAEAWPDYEARKLTHSNYAPRSLPLPEWRGQALRDKRLLVYAEQGLGDQIMFASCLRELLAQVGGCVIECAPRLVPIFRRSFPAARIEPQARDDASLAGLVQAAGFDYQVAIGSVPGFFRRDWPDFPRHDGYLHADRARVGYWKDRLDALGPGLKVGISWRGGAASTRRDMRSTQLRDWLPVLSQTACSFVSLQYGDVSGELETAAREHPVRIHSWSAAVDDYDETAALVTALDLVISVQTAVVHLAGALGTPAWVLVPAVAEWRYLQSGESIPWYPSLRLFRQQQAHQWQAVIAEVAVKLAQSRSPARPT